MIKPLLRTIPTMSGNAKLACTLLDYNKLSKDVFETNIRGAFIYPVSSSLFQKSIKVSLLNSSWEYDLPRFYKTYSDIFFSPCFDYNKDEMMQLDRTKDIKVRNTDFEYGFKRVSYLKSGCQFACFAPIYIDNVNDIPAYFKIDLNITGVKYSTKKSIIVNIKKNGDKDTNYIYKYLSKYINKINDDVVYMDNVKKELIYYGIDLRNGGFTKYPDSAASSLFNTQMPMQQFDRTISLGFERNNIAMRQVIPLCFYFNVDDIFTDVEKIKYRFATVKFSGAYYNSNDGKLPWYDFSWDYDKFSNDIMTMNSLTGDLIQSKGFVSNILNVGFPAFYDKSIMQYQFANRVTATFNRWKLKYSSDEYPYITNMSWAFSNNQDSNYKYREFPSTYTYQSAFAIIDDNNNYNMLFPLGDNKSFYDSINPRSANKYKNIINNYCLDWFDIAKSTDQEYLKTHTEEIEWADIKNGYSYYRSVLYNFNVIYDNIPNMKEEDKIDKFAFLVYPNTSGIVSDNVISNFLFSSFNIIPDTLYTDEYDTNAKLNTEIFNGGGSLFSLFESYNNAHLAFNDMYKDISSEYDNIDDEEVVYVNGNELGIHLYEHNVIYKPESSPKFTFTQAYINKLNNLPDNVTNYYNYNTIVGAYFTNNRKNITIDAFKEFGDAFDITDADSNDAIYKKLWTKICAVLQYNTGKNNHLPPLLQADFKNMSYKLYELLPIYKGEIAENNGYPVFTLNNIRKSLGIDSIKLKQLYINYGYDTVFNPEKFTGKFKTNKGMSTLYNTTIYYFSDYFDYDTLQSDILKSFNQSIMNGYCGGPGANKFPLSNVFEDPATDPTTTSLLYDIASFALLYICNECVQDILTTQKYLYYPNKEYNGYNVGNNIAYKINNIYNEFTNNAIYDEEIDGNVLYVHPYMINNAFYDSYRNTLRPSDKVYMYGKVLDKEHLLTLLNLSDGNGNLLYSRNEFFKQYKSFAVDTIAGVGHVKYYYENFDAVALNNIFYDSMFGVFYTEDKETGDKDYFNIVHYTQYYKITKPLWDIINVEGFKTGNFAIKNLTQISFENIYTPVHGENVFYNVVKVNLKVRLNRNQYESSTGEKKFLEKNDILIFTSANDEKYYYTISEANKANSEITISFYLNSDEEYPAVPTTEFLNDFMDKHVPFGPNSVLVLDYDQFYQDMFIYRPLLDIEYDDKFSSITYMKVVDVTDSRVKDTDTFLYPCFNRQYKENREQTLIYKNFAIDNISEAKVYKNNTMQTYYRYNANDFELMFGMKKRDVERFKNMVDDKGDSIYPHLTHIYRKFKITDKEEFINSNDDEIYNRENINTFIGEDGLKYGYYLLNVNIDNSGDTFNVRGFLDTDYSATNYADIDQINQLKCINYINGVNITTLQGAEYIKSMFRQLCPFIYIDINKHLMNLNTLVYPKAFNLSNCYTTSIVDSTNGSDERNLIFVKETIESAKKQILQRYTNSIVPLITQTSTIHNTYNIKLKEVAKTLIDTGKFRSIGDNILYRTPVSINKFTGYNVYDVSKDSMIKDYNNSIRTYIPLEYKHYNDSTFKNLLVSFEYPLNKKLTYNELLEVETDEKTLEVFKKYLTSTGLTLTEDQFLFLYNRYSCEYDTDAVDITLDKTQKLYTLTYKFKLL